MSPCPRHSYWVGLADVWGPLVRRGGCSNGSVQRAAVGRSAGDEVFETLAADEDLAAHTDVGYLVAAYRFVDGVGGQAEEVGDLGDTEDGAFGHRVFLWLSWRAASACGSGK